jgi:hypothetical protein
MIKFDEELLTELGLESLSSTDRASLIAQMESSLELRVGEALATLMSEAELVEFEKIYEHGDEAAVLRWLEDTCPDYAEAVHAAFADLKCEVRRLAPSILRPSK